MVDNRNRRPENDQGNREVSPRQEKSSVIGQRSPEKTNYLGALECGKQRNSGRIWVYRDGLAQCIHLKKDN